jgi:hypothetical protein
MCGVLRTRDKAEACMEQEKQTRSEKQTSNHTTRNRQTITPYNPRDQHVIIAFSA